MPKILLVEDDQMMLSLLDTLLSIEGYSVQKFQGGDTSSLLSSIDRDRPDIILLDVFLARLNGLEILHKIRQDQKRYQPPILMTSGLDMRDRCLQEGADGFLMKPYMPEDLVKQIHHLVMSQPTASDY